jgi:nicotinate-nucleotide pyrophosphorylase
MAVKSKTKKVQAKSKTAVQTKPKETVRAKSKSKTDPGQNAGATTKVRVVNKISPPRVLPGDDRKTVRGARIVPQYAYMKAPGMMYDFQVGDTVEVFCDHEKNKDRVRGWIRGIVVQVDNKMVAVQFRSNVFLTDGWMVPDRILWYPLNSEHIRPIVKKSGKREKAIPDY